MAGSKTFDGAIPKSLTYTNSTGTLDVIKSVNEIESNYINDIGGSGTDGSLFIGLIKNDKILIEGMERLLST